eukprot:125280_1
MKIDAEHIAVNCNPTPHSLDWNSNVVEGRCVDLVAYGACNSIAIYDPESVKIVSTLRSHSDRVNTVKWIKRCQSSSSRKFEEIVSGGCDNKVIVWEYDRVANQYEKAAILEGHSAPVTSLDVLSLSTGVTVVASTSIDCSVRLWRRESGARTWSSIQTIDCARKPMEAVAMTTFRAPNGRDTIILAMGGLGEKIHVYFQNSEGLFTKLVNLEGHEDWIRALAFCQLHSGDLMLASASQDKRVRLWRISSDISVFSNLQNQSGQHSGVLTSLGRYRHLVTLGSAGQVVLALEALLIGHENFVYSVDWCPPEVRTDGSVHQPMRLLTGSTDKTVMIWEPDTSAESDGVWVNKVRMGATTERAFGVYGAVFSPDARAVLAHTHSGALCLWRATTEVNPEEKVSDDFIEQSVHWRQSPSVGGHFAPATDLSWNTSGTCLISSGLDQTIRLHAQWNANPEERRTWHEISRPQVHGYDLNCVCFVPSVPFRFVSGAAEKVLRAFDAPKPFIETVHGITGTIVEEDPAEIIRVDSAFAPELGLSNAVSVEADTEIQDEVDVSLSRPPSEQELSNRTLWLEIQKLYGHGYELFALAANHAGTVVASACVAREARHACVRLWATPRNSRHWRALAELEAHSGTVTQLAFSPDDRRLLAVSRDRKFSVFDCDYSADVPSFKLQLLPEKPVHSRIIWSCSWSHDSQLFATGSRDKKVKIWKQKDDSNWKCIATLHSFSRPVTAVAFGLRSFSGKYILAVGFEDGRLEIWSADTQDGSTWTQEVSIPENICHSATVKRIAWRPCGSHTSPLFASCSADHSVRLFSITI